LGLVVLPRLLRLHHWQLLTIGCCRLRWVRRRCPSMIRAVHVVVVVQLWLWLRRDSILVHLHISVCRVLCRLGLLRRNDLLLLLLPLPAHALISLLLLHTRGWRPAGTRLERHWRDKGAGVFRLCDERMHLCLSWCPSFEGIEIQQSLCEVNEGRAIGHFCIMSALSLVLPLRHTHPALSRSASCFSAA
jgi:hypothetical protein